MGTGQCPVKRYNRYLRSLIAEDKVKPLSCTQGRWPALELRVREAEAAMSHGRPSLSDRSHYGPVRMTLDF
jgi:hypothetical protein